MSQLNDDIKTNGQRLWHSLEEMAQIGATAKGGCNRQTLTDEDRKGRQLFANWCQQAGMTVTVDSMGNMFALRAGSEPSLAPIAIGSHLDTQPTGGKYDGVLGVLTGLEIVRSMNEQNITTRRPIVIINWTNEEGARFAPPMLSSGVFAGVYTKDWAKRRIDFDGHSFGEELQRIGFNGSEPVGKYPLHAYYEFHIEQGPILEAENLDIGIVTHGQGFLWLDVSVQGKESHSGSTPMPMRKDALAAAAQMITTVKQIALDHGPDAVGTVGYIHSSPNSRNTIPGEVTFSVDFRHPTQEVIDLMTANFNAQSQTICKELGLHLTIQQVSAFEPVKFNDSNVDYLRQATQKLNYNYREMISGAGHDACYIARVVPTAMLFCPCVGGLSHNEEEKILPQWATAGANVLLHAVVSAANAID